MFSLRPQSPGSRHRTGVSFTGPASKSPPSPRPTGLVTRARNWHLRGRLDRQKIQSLPNCLPGRFDLPADYITMGLGRMRARGLDLRGGYWQSSARLGSCRHGFDITREAARTAEDDEKD